MQDQLDLLKNHDVDQTEDSMIIADKIKRLDIKCFVEVGVADGGSLAFYSYSLPKDCLIIGIDRQGVIKKEYKEIITSHCEDLYVIRGESQSPEIYDRLIDIIGSKNINFLHLDGDHSYEGIKEDFEIYSPLVADDGIIVIHDIHSQEGVKKFWNELKQSNLNTEEIESPPLFTNIGVVYN